MQDSSSRVSISTGTLFRFALVFVLFWFLFYIRDVVLIVLTAVVIASAIEPITSLLQKIGLNRLIAVISIYLAVGVVLAGVFYIFLPTLLNDATAFFTNISREFNIPQPGAPLGKVNLNAVSDTLGRSNEVFKSVTNGSSVNDFVTSIGSFFSNLSAGFVQGVTTIFGGLASLALIVVLSFYLAVQEDGVIRFLQIVTPKAHEKYMIDLWRRSQDKIGKWMQGQMFLGLLVGVLVYAVLAIIGVEYALFFALLAAVFETIPLFGPILSAIPPIIVAYGNSGISTAMVVMGAYIIIQQFENHLFYPLVVKKIVGISPILVILSLIIGIKLAGFLGALLSVPIAAAMMEYFNDLQKDKAKA